MEYTYRLLRTDGEERLVHVQATITGWVDGEPRQARGFIQDITERERTADALRESEARLLQDQRLGAKHWIGTTTDVTEQRLADDQLRQAQKMEAVGQLTGGIAHDFNNLLAVMLGNLELIGERAKADTGINDLVERGIIAAERGAALTHRLLAFSRKQTLMPTTVDLNRLVSGMADMLRRTLSETITVQTSGGADL